MHLLFVFLHLNFEEEIKGYSTLRPFRIKIQLNGVWSGSSASGNTYWSNQTSTPHKVMCMPYPGPHTTPHHFFFFFIYTNPHLWSLLSNPFNIIIFFLIQFNIIIIIFIISRFNYIIITMLFLSLSFYSSSSSLLRILYYLFILLLLFLNFLIYNFVHSLTIKNIEISASEVDIYGHIFHLY